MGEGEAEGVGEGEGVGPMSGGGGWGRQRGWMEEEGVSTRVSCLGGWRGQGSGVEGGEVPNYGEGGSGDGNTVRSNASLGTPPFP